MRTPSNQRIRNIFRVSKSNTFSSSDLHLVTAKLPKFKVTVRNYAALAFLKLEDVELGWIHIHSCVPLNIEDDRIIGLLCRPMAAELVFTFGNVELRRRNDAVEGWNHKINSKDEIPHTRLQYLFACRKVGTPDFEDRLEFRRSQKKDKLLSSG